MSYIDNHLLPDEQILFKTKKHLIIFFYPALLTVFLILYGSAYMEANYILHAFVWLPWLIALLLWSYIGIAYLTSEFAVTNKRIMMREGFFTRRVIELRISAISQVNVEQSLLGQILNYGIVSINSFGSYDAFTLINKPNLFQQNINQQLDKLTR